VRITLVYLHAKHIWISRRSPDHRTNNPTAPLLEWSELGTQESVPTMHRLSYAIAFSIHLIACSDSAVTTYEDEGSLCLSSVTDDGAAEVEITVQIPTCLSSSCSRVISTSCSVQEADGVLNVTSHAEVEQWTGTCTDDCRSLEMKCRSPRLAAGQYTLTFGAESTTLNLPATRERFFGGGSYLDDATCPDR
jgi:hypothetical protein